ncbi:hypothetical protein pzkkv8_136 [Klebsiella phage pzk-kv8]|jgi:hypothetical protein|nr:hypothetical protein pzkkv8_136 [Klebsiella phage pzk-kv8]
MHKFLIMLWYTKDGEHYHSSFEKTIFGPDIHWVARQYAEVNDNCLCKIFLGDRKIAEHGSHKQ